MHRVFLLSLVLLFGMIALGCQPAPMHENKRTVSVTGQGELSVAPEIATVRLAVQSRALDVRDAQASAADVVDKVLALASELGIPQQQVQSSQLRVEPEFDWTEGRQELRGYLVHREVRIELEDLDALGKLMERAMQAGVNHVSPPELGVREPRELHRQVLQLAAADARRNAETLAKSLEVSLGKVRTLTASEDAGTPQPMREAYLRQSTDSAAEQTYQSGRITLHAKVRAEFDVN